MKPQTIDDLEARLKEWEAESAKIAHAPVPAHDTAEYDLWLERDNHVLRKIREIRDAIRARRFQSGDWRNIGACREFDWLFASIVAGYAVLYTPAHELGAIYGGLYRESSSTPAIDKDKVKYYTTDLPAVEAYLPPGAVVQAHRDDKGLWRVDLIFRQRHFSFASERLPHALAMCILHYREDHL